MILGNLGSILTDGLYNRCPFLSAEMVRTYIRGIQGPVDAKHIKIATDVKHLAVHTGPESPNNAARADRLGFDAVVSQRAIHEHFLPPFRAAAEAGTSSFMCSYNAINGVPSCANPWLLTSIARDFWNRSDIGIQSDCGTLTYMTNNHHFTDSAAEAAADFFNAGGNTVCGGAGTTAALESGLLTEAVLTERVTEALVPLFRLGAFDSPSDVEWKDLSKYSKSMVGRPEHTAIAREAAQKGVVLLENRNRTLPLKPSDWAGKTILVTGPYSGNESAYPGGFCFGDSSTLQPNCHGSGMPGDILGTYYSGTPGHISTPIAAVRAAFPGVTILHVSGCTHPWCGSGGLPDAPDLLAVAAAAAKAHLVLFFGGVSGHVGSGKYSPNPHLILT